MQPLFMQPLSDDQAQQLTGGSFRSFLSPAPGFRGGGRFGWLLRNSRLVFQSIFNNVSQVNVAVNLALNGGTVVNNQTNVLTINNIL